VDDFSTVSFGGVSGHEAERVLEEFQARKKVLLELFSSGEYDVVHYAGQAYFDPQTPTRSGICAPAARC
jgi:hypothetical protein